MNLFNLRMGLTANDDSLPERLTVDLQDPGDQRARVPLDEMKKEYYRKRGWDAGGQTRGGQTPLENPEKAGFV